jgi:hypothetical protein
VLSVSLIAPGQRRSDAGAPPDALTGRQRFLLPLSPRTDRLHVPPHLPHPALRWPPGGHHASRRDWLLRPWPKYRDGDEVVALPAVRGLPRHAILLKRMGAGSYPFLFLQ